MDNSKKNNLTSKINIPILFETKSDCCGCGACYAICPKSAIVMKKDEKGFEFPKIDDNKCIRCYSCVKVCPIKGRKNN